MDKITQNFEQINLQKDEIKMKREILKPVEELNIDSQHRI